MRAYSGPESSDRAGQPPGGATHPVGAALAQAAGDGGAPQPPARKVRGERPSAVLAALGRAHSDMQARLARLQEERQALLARHEALEHWAASVEEFAAVTAPVRAAAAARAQGDAAERLRLQDAALAALLGHLGGLPSGGGSGGGGAVGASSSGGGGSNSVGCDGSSGGGSDGNGRGDGSRGVAADAARLPWAAPLANAATAEALLWECEAETMQGLAARMRGSVQALALLLQQVRGAPSPATPAAAARLADEVSSLACRFALTTIVSPSAAFGTVTLRLDTLQAVKEEPPPAFWDHCVEQARTTPQQDRAVAALLARWLEAVGPATARRAELVRAAHSRSMRGGAAFAGEADADDLLAENERCSAEIVVASVTVQIALYTRLLSPEQTAALLVSAYPYSPTFLVLERQFRERARRAAPAAAAAAAGETGKAPAGDGA